MELMSDTESDPDYSDYYLIKHCQFPNQKLLELGRSAAYGQAMPSGGAGGIFHGANYQETFNFIGNQPHFIGTQSQIYLFEIEQFETNLLDEQYNFLRIFIKECDINKEYILVLYINSNSNGSNQNKITRAKKKIILDDFNCLIKVYVRHFDQAYNFILFSNKKILNQDFVK